RTRREAQRTLLRRGAVSKVANAIGSIVIDTKKPLPVRVAALYTLQQGVGTGAVGLFTRLAGDATIAPWVLRALGETKGTTAEPMLTALKSPDARTRNEAMIALARWHGLTGVASDGAW